MGVVSSKLVSRLQDGATTQWPITATQVKNNADVQHVDDEALLHNSDNGIIPAAVQYVEERGNVVLITQNWQDTYDFGFSDRIVELRKAPLQSITEVQYLDTSYVEQTVTASDYRTDTYSTPGRLILKTSKSWPVTACEAADCWIEYKAGYGDEPTDVPMAWKQPIIVLATFWYEHPEAFFDKVSSGDKDPFFRSLHAMIDLAGRLDRYA